MIDRLRRVIVVALQPVGTASAALGVAQMLFTLLLGVALAAALVGGAIGVVRGFFPGTQGAIAFGLLVILLLMTRAAYRLQARVDAHAAAPHPRFVLRRLYSDIRPLEMKTLRAVPFNPALSALQPDAGKVIESVKGVPLSCSHVEIANEPEAGNAGVDVKSVIAHIEYMHEGEPVQLEGRWGADKEQVATRNASAPIADLKAMDFPSNGHRVELNIAIKHRGDEDCFAYNDDSVRGAGDWRYEPYRLKGTKIGVRVTLRGQGIATPVEWRFVVSNAGRGKSLEISVDPTDGPTTSALRA